VDDGKETDGIGTSWERQKIEQPDGGTGFDGWTEGRGQIPTDPTT
jgi:hypothetical protein